MQVGSSGEWIFAKTHFISSHAINFERKLFAWGLNDIGQLGLGNIVTRSTPIQIGTLTDWKFANGFRKFTCFIKTTGTLWSVGENNYGQLGIGNLQSRSSPVQISGGGTWRSVACGSYHALAIRNNGTLWAWGANYHGQLGGFSNVNISTPVQIGTDSDWLSVFCGPEQSFAIKNNQTLYAWGYNANNELGSAQLPLAIIASPAKFNNDEDWLMVSAGPFSTAALKTNHQLWVWGNNEYGQLGLGDTINRSHAVQMNSTEDWISVSMGQHHLLLLKTDNTLWSCGRNSWGQLGINTTMSVSSPVQVGTRTDWLSISCADDHSMGIRQNGSSDIGEGLVFGGRNSTGTPSNSIVSYYINHQNITSTTLGIFLATARYGLCGLNSKTLGYVIGGIPSRLHFEGVSFSTKTWKNILRTLTVDRSYATDANSNEFGLVYGGNTVDVIDGLFFINETKFEPNMVLSLARYALSGISSGDRHFIAAGTTGTLSFNLIDKFTPHTQDRHWFSVTLNHSRMFLMPGINSLFDGYWWGGSTNNQMLEKFSFSTESVSIAATNNNYNLYQGVSLNSESYGFVISGVRSMGGTLFNSTRRIEFTTDTISDSGNHITQLIDSAGVQSCGY